MAAAARLSVEHMDDMDTKHQKCVCQQFNSCCEPLALPSAYLVSDIKVYILNAKRSNYFSLESNMDVEDETPSHTMDRMKGLIFLVCLLGFGVIV